MKAIGTAQAIIGADYLRDNFDARIHLLGLGQEDLTTIYRELQDAQNRNLVPRIFGLRLALDPMRRTDPLYMNRNPSRPSPAWGHDFTPCVQQNHQISPNAKEGSFRMFTNAAQLTDAYVTFAQVGDEIGFILP